MIGVILAGGTGSRLKPLTTSQNKHLLHVYNHLMIDYPLSTVLSCGIKNIKIVTGADHTGHFNDYLRGGKKYNVRFSYYVQEDPGGIAQALSLIEEDIHEGDKLMVILGDNIIEADISNKVREFEKNVNGAHIFLKQVAYEELFETNREGVKRAKYGIAELDNNKNVIGIEEKPIKPKTNYVVTGIYLYDHTVFDKIKELKPSFRGEYEISDVNNQYVNEGRMTASLLQGYWLDAGDSIPGLLGDAKIVEKNPPKTISLIEILNNNK